MSEITLGGIRFAVIDLMKPFSLETEVFPGDPKPKRKIVSEIKNTGWEHYIHEIADHHFQPHADAPKHYLPELQNHDILYFDFDYIFNTAILIDLSGNGNAEKHQGIRFLKKITQKELEPYHKLLNQKGAVIIRTGYDKWLEANFPNYEKLIPYFTPEAAEYLSLFKNIKIVGTDSLNVDPPESNRAHRFFKNKMIVEGLVNLSAIPQNKRDNFDIQTSPLKISGATGSPVTAFAFIKL